MSIQPNQFEELARLVSGLYEYLELLVLSKMSNRLERGLQFSDWQLRKLRELKKFREELIPILQRMDKDVATSIYNVLEQVWSETAGIVDKSFPEGYQKANIVFALGVTDRIAIESFATAVLSTLVPLTQSILRNVEDVYRKIISLAAAGAIGGVQNWRQAVQDALNQFADQGIAHFVDKAGRKWGIQEYSEMAVRSAIMRTSVASATTRITQLDNDLVIISNHPEECPLCRPWEGKVLSISGKDERYPSLERARAAGLFHPNCGHSMGIYIQGLTEIPVIKHDPKKYEQKQQQRYIERQIRKWKKRVAVAVTAEEKAKAEKRLNIWKTTMKSFLKDTGRERRYDREVPREGRPSAKIVDIEEILRNVK